MTVTLKSIEEKYKDQAFANIFEKTKTEMTIYALDRQVGTNEHSSTIQFYAAVVEIFPKLFHFLLNTEEYKKIADTLSNSFGSKKYSGLYKEYYEKLPNVFRDIKQKDYLKETNESNSLGNFLKNIGDDEVVEFGYYYKTTTSNTRAKSRANIEGKKLKKILNLCMYE